VRSGIPHLLRFGVRELHEQITQRTDEASRLIARELLSVVRRLELYRQQDLIYAPVWTHYGMDAIVAAIEHEEARRAAMQAYELLRELTAGQQPLAGDARERQSLAKAEEALSLAIVRLGKPQDEKSLRILFYLRMEHCYTQLLASRIEAGEEQRRARLERLGTVYAEISADYPYASVPHYRRSIVHYELGRRTEAFEAISTALELVGEDPYLTQREHWVRSTIRRRIGLFFGDEASRLMEELKLRPGDGGLRELYLTNVFEAFQAVYTDFTSSASDQERDYLARLEARRRLNNIIYYACLYLEGGGSWITLQRAGFKRETMRRWLARLHDETIGHVPERNIVHTIGFAYQLLGQPQQAREAAERLVQLIVDSGADPQEDGVGRLLSDAFAWMRADAARQPEAAQPTAVG
jgi:tetratricopeptide (TPR) repeat protein